MENAYKINTIWLIVLYANNLLNINYVSPYTEPIIKENKLLSKRTFLHAPITLVSTAISAIKT